MDCRKGEMSRICCKELFQVSHFRQMHPLSENWNVGEVKCIWKIYLFFEGFTSPTNVGIVSCLTCEMSRKWHAPCMSGFYKMYCSSASAHLMGLNVRNPACFLDVYSDSKSSDFNLRSRPLCLRWVIISGNKLLSSMYNLFSVYVGCLWLWILRCLHW